MTNLDFILDPDVALVRYRGHCRALKVFLIVCLVFDILIYGYLYQNYDLIVASLADAYRDVTYERLSRIFLYGTMLDVLANVVMYFAARRAL
jgi:hypothetical protein